MWHAALVARHLGALRACELIARLTAAEVCVVAQEWETKNGPAALAIEVNSIPCPMEVWGVVWGSGGPLRPASCPLRLRTASVYPHHPAVRER